MLVSTPTSSPSSWLHPPMYLSSHPYACGPGWTREAGVADEGLPSSPAFVSHLAPDHSEDVSSTRTICSSGPLSPFRVFRRWFLDASEVTVRWWVFPKQINFGWWWLLVTEGQENLPLNGEKATSAVALLLPPVLTSNSMCLLWMRQTSKIDIRGFNGALWKFETPLGKKTQNTERNWEKKLSS